MRLNTDDRVVNIKGTLGTVVQADQYMVKVQFDDGSKPGWFDREDDDRLTLVGRRKVRFTVTVNDIDLDAWAYNYGIDRIEADEDFAAFASQHLSWALAEHLKSMGYSVTVEAQLADTD